MELDKVVTVELRMPRNMVRYFNALAQTIENEGSFDPYKDKSTREVIFNAPVFLECTQGMLDDMLTIYQAHYGANLTQSQFESDGRLSDINKKSIAAYPAPLIILIKHVNFLDYYDAPLLLHGFMRRIQSILFSETKEPPITKPEFEPQSLIEKVFIKETRLRSHLLKYLREKLSNLDIFDTMTRHLWPKLGPFVVCKDEFTIVATTDGLYGFGNNKNGILGLGETLFVETPTRIPLEHVSSFACNDDYSVFLTRDGLFECGLPVMRYREPSEETPIRKPTKILEDIGPIVSVACGKRHMLVLGQDGTLYGYGFNDKGQLSLYLNSDTLMLNFESGKNGIHTRIIGISGIISFACGNHHSIVLTEAGLFGCGSNRYGQLGLGDRVDRYKWTKIPIEGVISFWCGPSKTMILTKEGLFACGDNYYAELGLPDNDRINNIVPVLTRTRFEGVISVSFNGQFTMILTKDGLYGYGYFELGSFIELIDLPTKSVVSMATSETHYAIVTLDGLYMYGENEKGTLGLGHRDKVHNPTKLTSLRIGIEESPQLMRDLPSEIKIENEPETKKRRIDSLLCTRCDNIATHVEPFQERIRFCSAACYKDFFTPKAKLTQEY